MNTSARPKSYKQGYKVTSKKSKPHLPPPSSPSPSPSIHDTYLCAVNLDAVLELSAIVSLFNSLN
jgi:hypothetical protein